MQAIDRQPQRTPDGAPVHYERHRPEQTTLYRLVQQHAATFFEQAKVAAGANLSQVVRDEFDAFLACGILVHGFLRLRCGNCSHDKLVAFSCKRRGFCPSCGALRMAQTAAHLVDHVIPLVPVRQWVLLRIPSSLARSIQARPHRVRHCPADHAVSNGVGTVMADVWHRSCRNVSRPWALPNRCAQVTARRSQRCPASNRARSSRWRFAPTDAPSSVHAGGCSAAAAAAACRASSAPQLRRNCAAIDPAWQAWRVGVGASAAGQVSVRPAHTPAAARLARARSARGARQMTDGLKRLASLFRPLAQARARAVQAGSHTHRLARRDPRWRAGLWTCGRCAHAHRRSPWTTLRVTHPPVPSPTCPQPSTTINEYQKLGPKTLAKLTTDRLASRRRSQGTPDSYLDWRRLH